MHILPTQMSGGHQKNNKHNIGLRCVCLATLTVGLLAGAAVTTAEAVDYQSVGNVKITQIRVWGTETNAAGKRILASQMPDGCNFLYISHSNPVAAEGLFRMATTAAFAGHKVDIQKSTDALNISVNGQIGCLVNSIQPNF